jgi:hypothetical protein
VIFILTGLGRLAITQEHARVRQRGFILFIVGLLFVIIPLTLTTYQAVMQATDTHKATGEVNNWLQDTAYRVVTVNVKDRAVKVTIEGSGELKPAQELANQIALTLNRPVNLSLLVVPGLMGVASGP